MTSKASIAVQFPKESILLRALLLLAAVCLLVGIFSPIVTLHKLLVFENTFSVISGVMALLSQQKWLLFLVISLFSIVLPLLKLAILFLLVNGRNLEPVRLRSYLHWMHEYGRWSMLDVFVVAVLVVSVKLGAIASVETRYGLYVFTAAILLTMIVTAWVVRLSARIEALLDAQPQQVSADQ